MKISIASFLIILMLIEASAQNQGQKKTDSLLSVLKSGKPDTSKVNTLIDIANEFRFVNPDTSVYFANKAIQLAEKINFKIGIARGYGMIGFALMNLGDYEEAMKYCNDAIKLNEQLLRTDTGKENRASKSKILRQKAKVYNTMGLIYLNQGINSEALKKFSNAFNIWEEIRDKQGIAYYHINVGVLNNNQGNYPEALKNYFASLKLFEELGDKNGKGSSLGNIGNIYTIQGNYTEALKYFQKSIKVMEEIGDKINIAGFYNNIGSVYHKEKNNPEALKNYLSALKFFKEAGYKKGIAITYNNIGKIHYDQGNYSEALKYFFSSLKIRIELGEKSGIAQSYQNIGLIYSKQKKYNEASQYLKKGLSLGKEIGSLDIINTSYFELATLDSALGNFKQALEHYKMYVTTRDSMFNNENTRKLMQSQMQYDFDKKQLEDSLANEKDKRQKEISFKEAIHKKNSERNIFLFGGLAILVISGGLWSRLRYIRRSTSVIQKEKERSENLLLNILPYEVAVELKQTGQCKAKKYSMVTVMFTDFKDFTKVSEKVSAELMVEELNFCFSSFDAILQKYKVEKIKTVGDAYLCASGLPVLNHTHAIDLVTAAIEIRDFMLARRKEKEAKGEIPFEIRIGIHTGPVVAGIVGIKKFSYDIWGDTVNLAARMESSGEAGKVNISGATYEHVKDKFNCTYRGKIEAKNKGEIDMYFVEATNHSTL
jgi:adenylate cyclase